MTHEKRVTLAFVLCMLLALVWIQLFAAPRKKPAPEPKDGKPTVLKGKKKQKAQLGPGKLESGKKKQSPKKNGAAKKPKSSQGLTVTREAKLARVYTLESKRMRAVLSSEGGCVREVWLKNYFHKYVDRSAKGWEENPKNWLPLFPGWAALQEENKPPTDHLFQLHSSLGVELASGCGLPARPATRLSSSSG